LDRIESNRLDLWNV
jgi:hypothetical protein